MQYARAKQQEGIVLFKDKLIPNSGNKKNHGVMSRLSSSPNLSIVIPQQPLIFNRLSQKKKKAVKL